MPCVYAAARRGLLPLLPVAHFLCTPRSPPQQHLQTRTPRSPPQQPLLLSSPAAAFCATTEDDQMPPPPPTAPATNTNTLARVPPRPLLDHLPDQDLTSLAQTADAQLRQHFPFSRELLFRELVSSQSRRTLRKLAAQHTAEQILCRSGVREQSTKRAGSYETDAVPLGFELADVAELADKIPYAARYDEKMPGLRRVRAEAWSALLGGAESASALPVPVLADKLVLFNLVVSACVFEVLAVEQEVHINNHYRHMGDEEVDSDDGKFGYADAEQAKYYFGDDNFLHDKDVADARETAISAIEAVRRGIHVLGGGNAGEDADASMRAALAAHARGIAGLGIVRGENFPVSQKSRDALLLIWEALVRGASLEERDSLVAANFAERANEDGKYNTRYIKGPWANTNTHIY